MRKYILPLVSIITSVMVSFLTFAHAAVQEEGRIKKVTILKEPVEISGLRVNGQAVDFSQNFQVDEYWMDKVEVDVKNVSGKAILSLRIALYARVNIPRKLLANFGFTHEKRLAPGETVKIYTDKELNAGVKAKVAEVAEFGMVTYDNHAEMIVDRVTFEDGTIWALGTVYQIDPEDPKKLKKISDPRKNISQTTGRMRFAQAGFKIDDTFPKCGKAQRWDFITCRNIVQICSTLVPMADLRKSGDYSPEDVVENCSPTHCGFEAYTKAAKPYWNLGE